MRDLENRIDWSDEELLLEIGRAQDSVTFGGQEPSRRELVAQALAVVESIKAAAREQICRDTVIKSLVTDPQIQNRLSLISAIYDIVAPHCQHPAHGFQIPSASTAILISRTTLTEFCKTYWL